MMPEEEIRLLFETFTYFEGNTQNEDLDRCKAGNKYFFDNQTSLETTCNMIIKMQKVMYRILPPTSHEGHEKQFDRFNRIIKQCKGYLTEIETLKNKTDEQEK